MNEEELLKALERQIRSPEQATPPERALRPMRPLTDDERYERETKRILKAEERTDATDKVLSRLERMEHRILRIDNQLKEINRHTKATFNLVALIVAGVAFTGVAYALNKVLGNEGFGWLGLAVFIIYMGYMGYILFSFVSETWRGRKPASSEE